ncbi:S-adenosyl-L-methionine-dependent methyltransferase [Mytilinidion resinicola]|uniref:S-adenosyl-L-methionine-dependent methyltransferase n=1 Tax=Mytilinidion resinicola TaxID=574789 RepID=A0A6A6YNV5_9PEZI|nr:S-adenosyl-L-methionine-dependent methyltransferase [Mytilinidion resinicola]KAF2810239.1 S-adenosyl-L-methionine-dependent methyltransferase [Mytilinidion resinicola]
MATTKLSERALTGFAKGRLYDQYRPSYPAKAVTKLLAAAGVGGVRDARIVDLASGTGKFTELLAAREEGFEILAVEPHAGMRSELERKNLRRVDSRDGSATAIPAADGTIDAVFAAQAFHWFANQESLREIHRVLKPGGVLGMIWNIEDYNQTKSAAMTTTWESKLHDLTWTFDDNEPRFRHEKWKQVFDNQVKSTPLTILTSANPLFSLPLGEDEVKFTTWLSKESLWSRYSTLSHIAVLEGEELEKTKRTFTEIVNGEDVEANEKGEIPIHGVTYMAWTSKIPE